MRIKRPQEYTTPYDLANAIVNAWRSAGLPDYVAKIEVVNPGFINIWLQNNTLINQMLSVLKAKSRFGQGESLVGKKILLEHTSPNPQTTLMLGHLRNNFMGMAASDIFEFLGAKVTKDCIVNDRGVHLCRAIIGYLIFAQKWGEFKKQELIGYSKISDTRLKKAITKIKWRELLAGWIAKKSGWWQPKELGLKPDHTNLIWYVLGSRAYKASEKIKVQVEEILLAWEAKDKLVWAVWRQTLDWSISGYDQTYKRVGSVHDWVWFESDHYQKGKEFVDFGLKKGVFRKSQGAVVTDLAKYNLPDTVVVKTDGTALYLTQDLALTKLKMTKFPSDLYIWDIGSEQSLYFRQMFAVCEQLGLGSRDKFFHLSYALINFKGGGKMATRTGQVVKADEILDELHNRAVAVIKSSNQELRGKINQGQLDKIAEKVAVSALKYSLLKYGRETTIFFDVDESLALEGNSGPYLQYTYARTQSVIKKAKKILTPSEMADKTGKLKLKDEELALLRSIYRFPEVVLEAGQNFAPNLICNYIYDLAQKYNFFYNKWPILKAQPKALAEFRLALTTAVGQILQNGLRLLGIETPERM
jgi:arginyl-tRNA synthetase